MKKLGMATLALLLPIVWFSAADAEQQDKMKEGVHKAVCVLHSTKGHEAHGTIWFTQKGNEVEIHGEIMGLKPGMHAFHVHEFGDCSSPDAMSAGAHFNPEGAPHGGPHTAKRHVGDLGNIKADGTGKASVQIQDAAIKLSGPHSILGRSLIVHADPDDFKSQPAGNAGARVGCGVIGVAKP
jgi:Cu-Zn family superoxide dismutase